MRGVSTRALAHLHDDWQIIQKTGEHDERKLVGHAIGCIAEQKAITKTATVQ